VFILRVLVVPSDVLGGCNAVIFVDRRFRVDTEVAAKKGLRRIGYMVWRKSSQHVHITDTLLVANHNSIQVTQTATVKMEVVTFFETSVHTSITQCEDPK